MRQEVHDEESYQELYRNHVLMVRSQICRNLYFHQFCYCWFFKLNHFLLPLKRKAVYGMYDYTRRRFGGRAPLCGTGVTSRIAVTSRPAARARIADSRPEPGPLTVTSTVLRPCSCADLAPLLKPFESRMV